MAEYKGTSAEAVRQRMLEKKRQLMQEDFQRKKEQINKESQVKIGGISDKFAAQYDDIEAELKRDTVGLVTFEDFQKKREDLETKRQLDMAAIARQREETWDKKRKSGKDRASKLSFFMDEEDHEQKILKEIPKVNDSSSSESDNMKTKIIKNPFVDTSFLPDREREEEERNERERLRKEWLKKQEDIKSEVIQIIFSYWDGSGHRRSIECKKGNTIGQFLDKAKQDFDEIKNVHADNLIYIKEDIILPHHYTFYDFIINKVRGKSGPLFNFDVKEDIRFINDATKDKEEIHAGKVVERRWYDKNKHIFPASRWEVYNPEKQYGKYTIKDTKGKLDS